MANNETNGLRLAQVFATKAFRIPDYQCGYVWGEYQWNDLWDDIWKINEDVETGDYQPLFLGTISLKEIRKDSIPKEELWFKDRGNRFYAVVDGQQRLTTLEIMIFELVESLSDDDYEQSELKTELRDTFLYRYRLVLTRLYLFEYEKNARDSAFLLNRIFDDYAVILPKGFVNEYTNNLAAAKEWFREKIAALTIEQKLDLVRRIQTAIVFDIKYINDTRSERSVFEKMNTRGNPLSILKKLSKRILFFSQGGGRKEI